MTVVAPRPSMTACTTACTTVDAFTPRALARHSGRNAPVSGKEGAMTPARAVDAETKVEGRLPLEPSGVTIDLAALFPRA